MSIEERKLVFMILGLIIGLTLVGSLVVGLFSPFWCKVPVLNFVTCLLERDSKSNYQPELILDGSGSTEEPEEATQAAEEQPEAVPTVMLYDDLEKLAADDPQMASFLSDLKSALEQKDYAVIENLISETFNIAPYGGEYSTLNRQDAIKRIESELSSLSTNIVVDTSNEGREIAQELYVTPRESLFALVVYGLPEDSFSILGINKAGDAYIWSDMILFPKQ